MAKRQPLLERHPEIRDKLGTVPDRQLATIYGVSPAYIQHLRTKFGIAANKPRRTDGVRPEPTYLNRAFAHLVELWCDSNPSRNRTDLRTVLGQRRVSSWASGAEGREPPLEVLVMLADLVKREIVVRTDSVVIRHRSRTGIVFSKE